MENELILGDRQEAVKLAKHESAKADMKQHADKLIQGFEKLDESHARRAIWELVQNASDLSDDCEITIDFSKDSFTFSHKGKPFTTNTLISLIKQVSSKTSNDNTEEIGQFGTGFITTHSFGKKFKINSVLDIFGKSIEIKDFLIDRLAKDSTELVDKLAIQQNAVYDLIDKGTIVSIDKPTTNFSYLSETEYEINNVNTAEKDLDQYTPIVMSLNRKIKCIKVISKGGFLTEYKRTNIDENTSPNKITITINGIERNIYYLKSGDNSIEIILPLKSLDQTKLFSDSLSKLFLFFPLIGTENWGCNFIINSNRFAPLEARDGIHLKSKNDQTKDKENNNCQIIEDASELIFDFVEANAETIKNPIYLAYINFNTDTDKVPLNGYFTELKEKWVEKFRTYKLVETLEGRKTPDNSLFIADELLQNTDSFESIYSIISNFWKNLPLYEIAIEWTRIINEWSDSTIKRIAIEDIVLKIQEQGNLIEFDQEVLAKFYKYLIEINELEYFNDYKLLPNIKNDFVEKVTLCKPVNIPDSFINIADIIVPEIPKKFIKNEFKLNQPFEIYSRNNLSKDFNSKLLEQSITQEKSLDIEFRNALIELCCYFAPNMLSLSVRRQILPKICKFYDLTFTEKVFQNIEEDKFDIDYTPFRVLIKAFLNDIIKKCNSKIEVSVGENQKGNWLEENINFYRDCLVIIAKHSVLEDIVKTLNIFPNQNYELCNQTSLKVETQFPTNVEDSDYLKQTYEDIIGKVRNELVLNDFSNLLPERNERTGLELSSKLEQVFKENGEYSDIINHPNSKVIFKIVRKLTDNKEWENFFPTLSDKKAIIMMAKISDNNLKDDLFSIIGLDDPKKISLLGELSKNPNLERIIALGKAALQQEFEDLADFDFKKKIGVHIENLIRAKIGHDIESFDVIVEEKQNGQDFIIKLNGVIVYYIEVKSRWNKDNPIRMSKNQISNAIDNNEIYSLCCVEMADYKVGQVDRYEVKDIAEIIDRIKFINSIGQNLETLMKDIVIANDIENEITIVGDYKATIPRKLIKTGSSIDDFVNYLIEKLSIK